MKHIVKGADDLNITKDKIWERLTITNDFIFAKVMENKGIC